MPTANAGVTWQRMFLFFQQFKKDKTLSPAMDSFDPNRSMPYEWQFDKFRSTMLELQIEKLVGMADVVVIGYVICDYGIALIKGLKMLFPKKPILMEIDDYCFQLNDYSPAFNVYRAGKEACDGLEEQLKISDGVIVSTPYLKDLYADHNKNIKVMRNGVDFNIWNFPIKEKKGKKIKIGWAGAYTHSEDVRYIEKIVYRILDKYKNVEFYFMGGAPDFFIKKHPQIKCHNAWSNPYNYPEALYKKNFDIGLAPLLDNNFNRAKSNLRWLEYSALKIPTIASNVEDFKRTIEEDDTGYLCSEPEEWFYKLCMLIENGEKRKQIGENAYREVKKNFNMEILAKEYSDYLKGVYDDFK